MAVMPVYNVKPVYNFTCEYCGHVEGGWDFYQDADEAEQEHMVSYHGAEYEDE